VDIDVSITLKWLVYSFIPH